MSPASPPERFPYRSAHAATQSTDAIERACHSTDLAGTCPEWVPLVPIGTFSGKDGRGPWTLTDPAGVIKRSMQAAQAGVLPVDVGHEIEDPGSGGMGAEAAGWITALREMNGFVEAKIDWTSLGTTKVGGKLLRFISPVFYHDKQGVVGLLVGASLTNRPNLALKALNAQETQGMEKLKALMARLLAPFGMPDTTDEDALVARVTAAAEAEKLATKIITTLNLAKSATVADVERAINSTIAAAKHAVKLAEHLALPSTASADEMIRAVQARSTTDAAKVVPIEQFTALAGTVKAMQAKEDEQVIEDGIKAGKLFPALRENYKAQQAANREAFAKFVELSPVVLKPGTEARDDRKVLNAAEIKLTDEQRAICAATGTKEDDFKKTLAAEAAAS